jgi:hypothetical protein
MSAARSTDRQGTEQAPRPLLHVAVCNLDAADHAVRGAARVQAQRAAAHAARIAAARAAGAPDGPFASAPDGRPLPTGGWHWSHTHGGTLGAAVLWTSPVGVDAEPVVERRAQLVERILTSDERALLPDGPGGFIRAWTAKEAVLKATQLGLSGLGRCRVTAVLAPPGPLGPNTFHEALRVELDGRAWFVLQREHAGHVLAVTCGAEPLDAVLLFR